MDHKESNSFVFGYGSLICSRARPELTNRQEAHFVRVSGYERFWTSHSTSGDAVVGIEPRKTSTTNGILLSVTESELIRLDERESAYERIQISHDNIESLSQAPLPYGTIWGYVAKHKVSPHKDGPIIQSYLDVILSGCLEHSREFAREFLATTRGWNEYWMNDREQERYVRSLKNSSDYKEIDSLIAEILK